MQALHLGRPGDRQAGKGQGTAERQPPAAVGRPLQRGMHECASRGAQRGEVKAVRQRLEKGAGMVVGLLYGSELSADDALRLRVERS